MGEEETLDFPMILYKRSSCSFVKGSLIEVDVEPSVFAVSKFHVILVAVLSP